MIDLLPKEAVQELKDSLTEKRYNHSIGVMNTAFLLSKSWKNHSVDPIDLAWASLFHDCGKEIPKQQRIQLSKNGSIQYGRELLSVGKLNHAPLGAWLLKEKHGISNPDVLMAVAYHPLGHPDLTPIGWMVYIADFLEPGRTYMPERKENLEKARSNPLLGLKVVTDLRMQAVLSKDKPLHPLTLEFKKLFEEQPDRFQ